MNGIPLVDRMCVRLSHPRSGFVEMRRPRVDARSAHIWKFINMFRAATEKAGYPILYGSTIFATIPAVVFRRTRDSAG